jgi:hypothetical protein
LIAQIEHHLFPGLSVEALMSLSPVVRQTCKDYNVAYKSFDGYFDLLHDLLIYLKPLAAKPLPKSATTPTAPSQPKKLHPNSGRKNATLKLQGKEALLAPETQEADSPTKPIAPIG